MHERDEVIATEEAKFRPEEAIELSPTIDAVVEGTKMVSHLLIGESFDERLRVVQHVQIAFPGSVFITLSPDASEVVKIESTSGLRHSETKSACRHAPPPG